MFWMVCDGSFATNDTFINQRSSEKVNTPTKITGIFTSERGTYQFRIVNSKFRIESLWSFFAQNAPYSAQLPVQERTLASAVGKPS
jgi:hypothetical protein